MTPMGDLSRLDARARVFGVLAELGPASRAEVARRTALSPSTVSAVGGGLQASGLVAERAADDRPRTPGTLGRPPVVIALDRAAGVALGVDFGKRHLRVALSDLAHRVVAERHEPFDADRPAHDAIARATTLVDEVLAEAGAAHGDIVGVGMGLPGPVHRPSGEMGSATILPGWVGVRAADAMSEALGHVVEAENDASLGALSEWMWGAGRGAQNMAYLKVATGIGAGLIIRGRPFGGTSGTAGEIGHTVVAPGGPICRCGNRGCLETLAGSAAILASLQDAFPAPAAIGDVIAAARDGHAGCRRAIGDAGAAIGTAAATLCNLINPERIVVGGDLAAAGDLLLEPLRDALRRSAVRSAADDAELVGAALGERAEVLGAVALVLRRGVRLVPPALGDARGVR